MADKDQERAEELYAQLEPEARKAYIEYFSAHTPVELREEMTALVTAGLQPPDPGEGGEGVDPSAATLHTGDSVRVVAASGGDIPGSPGTVAITNSQVDFVQIDATRAQSASRDQSPRDPQGPQAGPGRRPAGRGT